MKRYGHIIFLGLVVLSVVLLTPATIGVFQAGQSTDGKEKKTVVIDAGHGGFDPGKVGINNVLEKDINLAIALKLQVLLEENDYHVVMVRTEDIGLYNEGDRNKKSNDMKNRVQMINEANPLLTISIHQNSYLTSDVKGAQVFYHSSSSGSQQLAELLQQQLITTLADGNHRVAKSNESYYLLKKTSCPIVIVECGFLSNPTEAKLLLDDHYQDKIAWAIHLGALQFLNENQVKE